MRVVAGTLRGRPIRAPDGGDTRPTSGRAREAVFNILEHAPWSDGVEQAKALDLFAGSGAMGIEALSRGAAACLFVEQDQAAFSAIRDNLSALGLGSPRASLLRRDAAKLGARPPTQPQCDLVFLDPPYRTDLGETALAALVDGAWLAQGAVLVFERHADEALAQAPGLEVVDQRRYGVAQVQFLRRL